MPCYDDRTEVSRSEVDNLYQRIAFLENRNDALAQLLCQMCAAYDGQPMPQRVQTWWQDHKEKDQRRRESEEREKEREKETAKELERLVELKEQALRKLTPEEIEALKKLK